MLPQQHALQPAVKARPAAHVQLRGGDARAPELANVIADERRPEGRPREVRAWKHGQRGRRLVPHETLEREDNVLAISHGVPVARPVTEPAGIHARVIDFAVSLSEHVSTTVRQNYEGDDPFGRARDVLRRDRTTESCGVVSALSSFSCCRVALGHV